MTITIEEATPYVAFGAVEDWGTDPVTLTLSTDTGTLGLADLDVTYNGAAVITAGVVQPGWDDASTAGLILGDTQVQISLVPDGGWVRWRIYNGTTGDFTAPRNGFPVVTGTFLVSLTAPGDSYSDNPWAPICTAGEASGSSDPAILTTTLGTLTQGVAADVQIQAGTPLGAATPWDWTVAAGSLPAGLSLTEDTSSLARITGTPSTAGAYSFDLRITRTTGSPVTDLQAFSGSVASAGDPPTITTAALDDAEVGVPYTMAIAVDGGAAPLAWSATGLPTGLTIDADTGEISGTPSGAPGTYTVEITVEDANTDSDSATLDLEMLAAVTITGDLNSGDVGVAYTDTLTATGGAAPLTWAIVAGALPLGLTLAPSTGAVTGTPLVAGDFDVTVEVTDTIGGTDTADLTITVRALDDAPDVTGAVGLGPERVRVLFSEPMRVTAALLDPASYTLTPGIGAVARAIVDVRPATAIGPTSVVLTFAAPLTAAAEYRIDVDPAVESMAGLTLDPARALALWVVAALAPRQEPGQRLVVIAEIEAIGEGTVDGARPYRFCSRRPRQYQDYDDGIYYPDLAAYPSQVEQVMSPLGGVATSGEMSVVIVDAGRDRLTRLLAIHRRAVTRVAAAVERGDTSVTFTSNTGLAANRMVWAGAEAILLLANTAGATWTVTRAQLDTAAQRHSAGAPVFLGTPIVMGRRLRVFVGYNDPRHSSADEEEIENGYAIDTIELTPDLGAWVLRGRSQLKYLDRLIDRRPLQGSVLSFDAATHLSLTLALIGDQSFSGYRSHFGDRLFIEIGDEILQMTPAGAVDPLPVAGTLRGEWREGDKARQVFVARADQTGVDYGSFRMQDPGAETSSRSTGVWRPESHAIPILLAILTGKADLDDNTPDNYLPGSGNYSALPPGVGLGTPAAEISFASALDVWHRAPYLRLEHFVLRETETGREAIDRICRLTGIEITTVDQQIHINYVRTPLADDVVASWGLSNLVARDDGDGVLRPAVSARLDASLAIGAVTFRARNSRGDDVSITYSDADFRGELGDVAGLYSIDEKPLEIDARDVRVEDAGGDPLLLQQRALQIIRAYRRIPWRFGFTTPRDQRDVQPGQLVRFSYPQIPDLESGRRGVQDLVVKVLAKREVVSREAVEIQWDVISYPSGRAGRIAPAARVAGAMVDGVVPIAANRYTDPMARGGLPGTDADAFTIGDRVALKTRGGLVVATTPPYQTVLSIGTNALELDGDFGGAVELAAGYVLAFVGHATATEQQTSRFVFLADDATRTVGASSDDPWTYGEG